MSPRPSHPSGTNSGRRRLLGALPLLATAAWLRPALASLEFVRQRQGGVAAQEVAAAWACTRAWSTSAVVASCTWPTTSLWSAGLRTGWVVPAGTSAASRGAAVQAWLAVACSVAASSVSVFSFDKSSPRELLRWAPYSAAGSGMRGWGRPAVPSVAACWSTTCTGLFTSSSSAMVSSAMRFTNEVLAPFSSRRRTR